MQKPANKNPDRRLTTTATLSKLPGLSRIAKTEDYRKEKEERRTRSGKKRERSDEEDEVKKDKCPRVMKLANFDQFRAGKWKLNYVGNVKSDNETHLQPSNIQRSQLLSKEP